MKGKEENGPKLGKVDQDNPVHRGGCEDACQRSRDGKPWGEWVTGLVLFLII